ncbi:MAG: hypothetical protein ABSG59_25340 [Verrucomicrobiota bacterium]|jgi:hypothetical protein
MQTDKLIAFFPIEVALDPAMPTYSGGLAVPAWFFVNDRVRLAAYRIIEPGGTALGQTLHRGRI